MAKYPEFGQAAERLFCEGNTLETISKILGVSVQSLSDWKNKYEWDLKRQEYLRAPKNIADKIAGLLDGYLDNIKVSEDGINKSNADAIVKLSAAMTKLGGVEDTPSMTYIVLQDFIKWINRHPTFSDENWMNQLFGLIEGYLQYVKETAYGRKL